MRISNRIPLNGINLDAVDLEYFLDNEFDYRIYKLLDSNFVLRGDNEFYPFDDGFIDNKSNIIVSSFKALYTLINVAYKNDTGRLYQENLLHKNDHLFFTDEEGGYRIIDNILNSSVFRTAFVYLYRLYEIDNFVFNVVVDEWEESTGFNKREIFSCRYVYDNDDRLCDEILELEERIVFFKDLDYYKNKRMNNNGTETILQNVSFFEKAEKLFIQLKYCIAIEPEPVIFKDGKFFNLMIEPDNFFELANKYGVEYPFNFKAKIIELKTLMIKEGVSPKDAMVVFEELKSSYWGNGVIVFDIVLDALKQALISMNKETTDHIIAQEIVGFYEYLQNERSLLYDELIELIGANAIKKHNTKPTVCISPNAAKDIAYILKPFIEQSQFEDFKTLINTFGTASPKILFKSNGNRLSDTFKKLIENDFIVGCTKDTLINWIVANFQYLHRGQVLDFKPKTVEQTISENKTPCKTPIIDIIGGEIQKSKAK